MRIVSVAGIVLLLAGCAEKPQYYASADFVSIDSIGARGKASSPTVSIDLFATNPPRSKSAPTLLNLSAEGQAEVVKAYAGEPEKLQEVFARPISAAQTSLGSSCSALKVKRSIRLTIATNNLAPSDRITQAKIVAKASDGWRFKAAEGFEAVRSDLKIATVIDTLTRRLKGSAGVDFAGIINELVDVGAEGELTAENKVTRDLQFEVVEFLPLPREESLDFFLKAPFPQVNIAGAYTGDVTLEYDGDTKNLVITAFDYSDPTSVSASRFRCEYLPEEKNVSLDISMSYRARMVQNTLGRRSLEEDDDDVDYIDVGPETTSPSVSQSIGSAVIGKQYPKTKRILDLGSLTKAETSALLLDGKPLLLFVPGEDASEDFPSCILHVDGAKLLEFKNWITADSENRVTQSDSGGRLLWALIDPLTSRRLDASRLANPDDLEIVRIALNDPAMPIPTLHNNYCPFDLGVGGN